jgi:hypothetical protein
MKRSPQALTHPLFACFSDILKVAALPPPTSHEQHGQTGTHAALPRVANELGF